MRHTADSGELLEQIAGAELRSSDYQEYFLHIDPGDVIGMVADGLTESHIWARGAVWIQLQLGNERHAGEGARSIADAILHDWASRSQWREEEMTSRSLWP